MKKTITLALGICLICFSASLSSAEILYQTNFDNGNLNGWTHIPEFYFGLTDGEWSITNGALQVYSPSWAQCIRLDTLSLPDSYIIEFDTKTVVDAGSASLIGFYTHWSTWSNWIGHGYRPGRFNVSEWYLGNRVDRLLITDVKSDIDPYQWHHIKYIKDGDTKRYYFDGDLIYERFFQSNLIEGYLVFTGGNGGVHQFDNLIIRTIEPSIDDVLTRFADFVEQGTLTGIGPGNSANGRLNAFGNMLEMAADLIDIGDIEGACGQLTAASNKCDGSLRPPDFIAGPAAFELHEMILDLMADIDCN